MFCLKIVHDQRLKEVDSFYKMFSFFRDVRRSIEIAVLIRAIPKLINQFSVHKRQKTNWKTEKQFQ